MSRKLWIFGLGAVAVLFVAAYVASPVLAVRNLTAAAKAHDAERLSRSVDFPAVRESVKSQLNAMFMRRFNADPELRNNPFAGLALTFAPAVFDQAIDAAVTPEGIATMLATGEAKPAAAAMPETLPSAPSPAAPAGPATQAPSAPGAGTPSAPAAAPKPKAKLNYGYQDLGTFVVSSTSASSDHKRIDFVLRRQGLFGWRLVRIQLPPDLMD